MKYNFSIVCLNCGEATDIGADGYNIVSKKEEPSIVVYEDGCHAAVIECKKCGNIITGY